MRLIVIGGGAAGFFCAVTAARLNKDLQVTIVEKTGKLLSKVRISGGGRCNVTHACFDISEILGRYPRGRNFVKKTFHQFFTTDTIRWFEERGVRLKTEADGRMFPVSDDSETITRCLLDEASRYSVNIRLHRDVKQINRSENKWLLEYADGETESCEYVCVACGGYPKSSMFEWLVAAGHTIEKPVPSLFTFNLRNHGITGLMGIAVKAAVKIRETKMFEEGPVLITHWGLSGPAVLKLSARAARDLEALQYHFVVLVNWCPDIKEATLKDMFFTIRTESGSARVHAKNPMAMPQRLWEYLCTYSEIGPDTRWADLSSAKQNALIRNLSAMELKVEGKTTFKEEFVTAGGIVLSEIDHNTMQSKVQEGLFFAGEILNVDGVTGGFNFQHAWTSGWIAGKSVAAAARR